MVGPEDWEGAAAELLDATCTVAPVNMLDLADACGLDVQYWSRVGAKTEIETSTIWVESRARPERMQGLVAHELGHYALDRAGLPQSELGATYVGGCLRLPRREMLRDVREHAWSPTAIHQRHPHASVVAIGVRITQLRTATLALFDPHGRTPAWRIASESVGRDLARRPTPLEHEVAIEAWMAQREVRRGELVVATPLPHYTDGEHRVLVVSHAAELRRAA